MKFQILRTFENYIDANLLLGQLESEGIRCWLKGENTVTIDPILSNAIGGIKLMVLEEDMEKAIELYKLIEQKRRESFACPYCHNHDIEYITSPREPLNWIAAIGTWLLGNYALSAKQVWHCFACKKEFDTPYETPRPDAENNSREEIG